MIQEFPVWTDLAAVLIWLVGAGGAWVVGEVVSYLAENWVFWHTLPPWVRKLAPIVAAPLISIAAKLLLDQAAVIELLSPWFSIVAYSILAYLATQKAHVNQVTARYGEKAKLEAMRLKDKTTLIE